MSWAKFCPQTHQSAGKSKSKGRGRGNPWLAGTLGRIAFANSSRADTFLGARYRRLARRRGKQKAIVATGNSVLTVVYYLLSNPEATFFVISGLDTRNPASTCTAVPVIWPPNYRHSPASRS